jgi:4-methylaminobutanoate oxidase (formaldehyde-forming)
VPGGYRAIESLRLEKGYRVWGTDVTSTDTPLEAGLGFAVRMDKGDFLGRRALEDGGEPRRRLVCLVVDDPRAVVLGSEPVRIDGDAVGRVTSGGYGYTVARSIAYAYLPREHCEIGRRVEVGIFGRSVGAEVVAEPLFDPTNARVRA